MFGTLISILTGAIALNDVAKKADADYEQREHSKETGGVAYNSSSGWRATSTNEKVWMNAHNDMANGHNAVVGFKSGKVYKDYSVEGCNAINRTMARLGCPFKLKEVQITRGCSKIPYWVPYNHIKGEYYLTKLKHRSDGNTYDYISLGSHLEYGFDSCISFTKYTRLTADQYVYYGGVFASTAYDSDLVARIPHSIDSMLKMQEMDLRRRAR